MEIVGILIACLIVCCLVGIISYSIGHNKKIQEVHYDTLFKKKEYEQISLAVADKQQEISRLNEEYNQKKAIIDSTSESINNEYHLRELALEEKFKIKEEQLQSKYDKQCSELQTQYQKNKENYEIDIKSIQEELNSLSQTKAAIVEAMQREIAIQEQADLYRLNITQQDSDDISFLRSIQYRISKPRLISMLIWQNYFQPIAKEKFPLILPSKDVCGIYKITNQKNNLSYIGKAGNVRNRWNEHCKHGLGIDTPQNNKLYKAMLKDGLENFTFELVEACLSEELDDKERYYIELYNSVDFGYNGQAGNKTN